MPITYVKIGSVDVGAGGATSILFSSIPQTYTDLLLVFSLRLNGSGNVGGFLKLNGTVTNPRTLFSTGSSISMEINNLTGFANADTYTANTFSSGQIYVPNYTAAQSKPFSYEGATENNATAAYMGIATGLIANTSPTTTLELYGDGLRQYSSATLYGIKNS